MARAALLLWASSLAALPASASVTTYTNSAAFAAAATGLTVETYATGTSGQAIPGGSTFNGLTYAFATGSNPFATLLGGVLTPNFNSVSGLSLGGTQSTGQDFFFGGNTVTVTFPVAVTAVGVLFNVNLNSGNYTLSSGVGSVSNNSSVYDTGTFVFDGLISTTPFTSVTLASTNALLGSFNIPEIEFLAQAVPEPGSVALLGLGAAIMALARKRQMKACKV